MNGQPPSPATHQPTDKLWYANAMEQLVEVVQLLSLARDLPSVMEIVRHAARRLTGADGATFVLRDDDKCFYAEEDAISPLWKGQRFPMSACISGWAMLNKQAAVIEDIYADPRIPADAYRPTFVHSLVMVPIRTIDPVGAIGNYWATQHLPSPDHVKVLQALADTTAVALENVRVYENLEHSVRQRTSELQSILDNVPVGIVFTVNDKLVRANPQVTAILGNGDAGTQPPASLPELLSGTESGAKQIEAARSQFARNEVFVSEQRLKRPHNRGGWVRLVARSLAGTNLPNNEIWVITDISERKERELKLNELKLAAESANQAKDAFLATMSHEIRTPLTGMLGMLELLSMTRLDNEQHQTLDAAWDSGRGLLRIVSDILDWSKIEEGKLGLSPRPTSIPQLLQEVVNTYSRVASSKSLLLWQHADARLTAAYIVDPLRLSQVLNNFVSNAIKFTHHGEIELRAELVNHVESGDRIRFSVKDTGVGIAENVQQRLFERYRQESADTARMYGGTGLGLAICRRLADMMDGQIELKSELGQGSAFSITLTLPVSGAPGEAVPQAHPEVKQRVVPPLFNDPEGAPLVLAVDDHPINRELLARQIKLLGMNAETAENGLDALQKWQAGRYAMVISDCHMPEMDGYKLAGEIRRIEDERSLPHTPLIAWTANALAEEAKRCYAAGMDALLVKPASLSQLRQTVAQWMNIETEDLDTAAPHPVKQGSPIDHEVLEKVVADADARNGVLRDFMNHIRTDRVKLQERLARNDRLDVERTAHRMSGSSRMVGAGEFAAACSAIEQAARDGDMEAARQSQASLDEALNRLETYLADLRQTGAGQ